MFNEVSENKNLNKEQN